MPIEINGVVYHTSIIYLNREEATPRFEICGGCAENKGGLCSIVDMEIRAFIHMANSGCPISKWGPHDISDKIANIPNISSFGCCP